VQLHGLTTQVLNSACGVVRDPLNDGRVGIALTVAPIAVLERYPTCRIKIGNLALLPPAPCHPVPSFSVNGSELTRDHLKRVCDNCLTDIAGSGLRLHKCAACQQAFYCNQGTLPSKQF
jgi:hypothetical protein